MNNRFRKSERLNSKLIIDKLFAGGNRSSAVFPLRVVYMPVPVDEAPDSMNGVPVSVLISVPKKRFHHAVDRNRMKRLVREAYRTNKGILWDAMEGRDFKMAVAFVCTTDSLPNYHQVQKAVVKALTKVSESVETMAK